MRAFVAIELPDDLRAALVQVQDAIPVGRAVPEGNLHLTLAFLDDQPGTALRALHETLSETRLPGAMLTIRGARLFGGRSPRLFAAEALRNPDLAELHRVVRVAIHLAGIALPRERFRPHVTLTRFHRREVETDRARIEEVATVFAGLALDPCRAEAVGLYRSTLTEEGAIYEELARYPLEGGDEGDLV